MNILRVLGIGVATAVLAACSSTTGGGGGSASPSASGPQTYTDPVFGYSVTYSPPFTIDPAVQLGIVAGSAPLSQVSLVATPAGPQEAAAGFGVAVFANGEEVSSDNLPAAKKTISEHVLKVMSKDAQGSGEPTVQFGPLTQTEVAGNPTLTTEGHFTYDNAKWLTKLYFVMAGTMEYELVLQGPAATWSKREPAMTAMVDSFTVSAAGASATPTPSITPTSGSVGPNAAFCNGVLALLQAKNTISAGQSTGNQAAVSQGKQAAEAAVGSLAETLPKDAPASLRGDIEALKTEIAATETSGSPSPSPTGTAGNRPTPSPSASAADAAAAQAVEAYAAKTCGLSGGSSSSAGSKPAG